ncbi:hypothetical protein E1A91_A04G034900v1 [Gossypium mustelinum]|uniref:Uncharacterized protein n=2 Tax=Gossypium TaxID=3633 RepID=A0A5D2ZLK8_GOSMU|nr:hypothetical protein ES332_A04G039200v1 [Gossypium tomentosum]TYJ39003.1 hypothetical protein E1A91_A04G034900v1 [Gossypium mustelinum]
MDTTKIGVQKLDFASAILVGRREGVALGKFKKSRILGSDGQGKARLPVFLRLSFNIP